MKTFRNGVGGALLVGITVCFPPGTTAAVTTAGCASPASCSLAELAGGASLQIGSILFTDWTIANTSFDLSPLMLGGFEDTGLVNLRLTPTSSGDLSVGTAGYDGAFGSLTLHYRATDQDALISKMVGNLRYRQVSGVWWNSPSVRMNTAAGISQGLDDLGRSADLYSLNEDRNAPVMDFTDRDSIWITSTYSLAVPSGNPGFARGGYLSSHGIGPAYENVFYQVERPAAVPLPAAAWLLGSALLGTTVARRVPRARVAAEEEGADEPSMRHALTGRQAV